MGYGCAVIVNPAAGNGRARKLWPRIAARLAAAGLQPDVQLTTSPDSATHLARRALRDGHQTLIAVGGDGTINEIVNGFFDAGEQVNPNARLGIVCCGTGADFIRTIALPRGEPAIAHIAEGRGILVDVGFASFRDGQGRPATRHFLNFADIGLGGETVLRVNRTTKAFGGFASFLWGAVQAILRHRGKPVEIALDGGVPVQQTIGDIVVANGRYFGGGMFVAPRASLVDGLLDVFVLRDVPKRRLLLDLLPKVYRGTHINHPDVWWRPAKTIAVTSPEPLLLDIDGELVGSTDVELRVLPRALSLLVPPRFLAG